MENEENKMNGMVEMRLRSALFTVKFLKAKQPCVIMELKLPGIRKDARKKKPSREEVHHGPWPPARTGRG